MENADEFQSVSDSSEVERELTRRIEELLDQIASNDRLILAKDRLLSDYWERIQSMRLTSRARRLVTLLGVPDQAGINRRRAHSGPKRRKGANSIRICIKIAAFKWSVAHYWGDYHFSIALRKQLIGLGYSVSIQTYDEWYARKEDEFEVILVIRGLTKYVVGGNALHLMWNISHPENVGKDEYESYEHVFVASELWTEEVDRITNGKASCLLQCTDPGLFRPPIRPVESDILFVGNSRGVKRPIIRDLLPCPFNLSIYGTEWEGLVERGYIKGQFIEQDSLHRYYGGAKVLLNDHWDDMRTRGFISNRIFDGLACGAFIVSDQVEGIKSVLGDSVITYSDRADLLDKIAHYLQHEEERRKIALAAIEIIAGRHTFQQRSIEIDRVIREHIQVKASA